MDSKGSDLFGGSGFATTALFPQDKVKQVYNEKNRSVYKLFEVISSQKYKEMQEAIQNIQEDLGSESFDFDRCYKFDIASTIDKYKEFKENNKKLDERALEAIDEEKELRSMVGTKFIFDENMVINFMTEFPQKVDEYLGYFGVRNMKGTSSECLTMVSNTGGYVQEIENTLEAKQKLVGGSIQVISITPEIVAVLNDEGKLIGLPVNRLWIDENDKYVSDIGMMNLSQ